MAIGQSTDIENGGINRHEELEQPFIQPKRVVAHEDGDSGNTIKNGSIGMVLLSTGVAVCGSFQFGICVGYSAPSQSAIRKDLRLSITEYSMFGSILSIGAVLGAFTSGKIADSLGRKGAMRVSSVICTAGWLAIYFAQGATLLDIGRFLTGYGISSFSYVVPVFIAEIAPKNLRGGLATLNQLFIILGASFTFIIGTILSWRTLSLIAILPCIILVLGQWFIPESPRWLAKVGREEEFEVALQRLHGKDADVSGEKAEIQEYIVTSQSLPKANILDLFQRRYIRSVIIGVGLMVFQQFAGINGVQFYASETFEAAGFSGSIGTTAYACLQVPITLLGAFLMDKSGRRVLVMVSAAGMFIGSILVGISFSLKGDGLLLDWVPILAVSGVLVYVAFFSIGMGAGPWVIMSEIFPINVKGVGGSLVVFVNWSGAWVVSYTYNSLMNWSSSGTYYLYGAVCVLTILFVAKVVPETKGKTLEEIQASLNP
ncbi:putative major facilitator, sugar transporter, major facilitator superfamily [Rosa chinensis]|uniref:Putative major facilitator, sugar transporter, major facilitator superfamily n=1 Tax=Rosa chinensis TaxID=74649 RepID=A0A2P6QXX5_ROSCH|nr:sugar transporter ERD6-like 16 isoform X1 [Rosa chinensis]PRQ39021.1 putative major facilitator, sugar transporter, major facilitator superfamily [Rosa chinensis]